MLCGFLLIYVRKFCFHFGSSEVHVCCSFCPDQSFVDFLCNTISLRDPAPVKSCLFYLLHLTRLFIWRKSIILKLLATKVNLHYIHVQQAVISNCRSRVRGINSFHSIYYFWTGKMSADLQWMLLRKNSCFLLKNQGTTFTKVGIDFITIHWSHYLFSDWPKAYSEFSKSVPVMSSSCRLYNNHVKDTQGHR